MGNQRAAPVPIKITYGYSRDHRPDLKQFILDLICSSDGDVPLFLRVASGNESDSAGFAQIFKEFKETGKGLSAATMKARIVELTQRVSLAY